MFPPFLLLIKTPSSPKCWYIIRSKLNSFTNHWPDYSGPYAWQSIAVKRIFHHNLTCSLAENWLQQSQQITEMTDDKDYLNVCWIRVLFGSFRLL